MHEACVQGNMERQLQKAGRSPQLRFLLVEEEGDREQHIFSLGTWSQCLEIHSYLLCGQESVQFLCSFWDS